jgi:hypothetical protein
MPIATTIGLAILAGAAWAGSPETPAAASTPRWLTDYAAAQAEARRTQRPILAVLH